MPLIASKLSSKGQVTIPKKIRESLRVSPDDWIEYQLQGSVVVMRRAEPFDRAFHPALSEALTDWSSQEDEEAFRDL